MARGAFETKQGDGSLFYNPLLSSARLTFTGMVFIPGETRRISNSKIKKNVRGIHQKKYFSMMIIENLLIFLINPCALTNTNWDFKYLKELDGI